MTWEYKEKLQRLIRVQSLKEQESQGTHRIIEAF